MNREQVEGRWRQLRGSAQEKWGRLTADDLDIVDGRLEQLAGRLQVRYGMARDQAERAIDEWLQPLRGMS